MWRTERVHISKIHELGSRRKENINEREYVYRAFKQERNHKHTVRNNEFHFPSSTKTDWVFFPVLVIY